MAVYSSRLSFAKVDSLSEFVHVLNYSFVCGLLCRVNGQFHGALRFLKLVPTFESELHEVRLQLLAEVLLALLLDVSMAAEAILLILQHCLLEVSVLTRRVDG